MKKYRVEYQLLQYVEAETPKEAIEEAIKRQCNCDYYIRNFMTNEIEYNADVWEQEDD